MEIWCTHGVQVVGWREQLGSLGEGGSLEKFISGQVQTLACFSSQFTITSEPPADIGVGARLHSVISNQLWAEIDPFFPKKAPPERKSLSQSPRQYRNATHLVLSMQGPSEISPFSSTFLNSEVWSHLYKNNAFHVGMNIHSPSKSLWKTEGEFILVNNFEIHTYFLITCTFHECVENPLDVWILKFLVLESIYPLIPLYHELLDVPLYLAWNKVGMGLQQWIASGFGLKNDQNGILLIYNHKICLCMLCSS